MSTTTNIEWANSTFNPWIGCSKVSPGCAHCYAETLMDKRFGKARWGKGERRILTSIHNWYQPLVWDMNARKRGTRPRVFCASVADVFDPEIPYQWRYDLFELIEATSNLDWLILTKRPEKIGRMIAEIATPMCEAWDRQRIAPANVWLGTSVEDQTRADIRIPALLKVPAAIHFLSVEPLLGPVHLGDLSGLDWVIVGGESGPRARPMRTEWVFPIRDQCVSAGVAFFFKQWGGRTPKCAGRTLDGHIWDQIPCSGENISQ